MTRDEALAKLRPTEADLRARGIEALYLFGSVARNEAGLKSDVDLACDIDPQKLRGLDFYILQDEIADALEAKVDFVERDSFYSRVRARAEPELVRVF